MRHVSAGTPSSDDFDLDGSMSPEVKYVISHESFHQALFNCFYSEESGHFLFVIGFITSMRQRKYPSSY